MKNDAQKFVEYLEEAGQILEGYPAVNFTSIDLNLKYAAPEHFDLALFEQWSDFCESGTQPKPPIRIVHHMSCTGGTLISKCLAAMPNVALLSEVHPLSRIHIDSKPIFAPSDLTYLATHGRFPFIEELSEKIFKANIDVIAQHVKQLGKYLVIREHSHSDYLVGETPNETSTIRNLLQDHYPTLSVLTVRHPVDSYLSLVRNGWIHFSPPTFDEYCQRYLCFLAHNEGLTSCKYEDFVADPDSEIKRLCEALELPFNEDFLDVFDVNVMSGDSGRTSDTIEKRTRRDYDKKFLAELNASNRYPQLCEHLHYDPAVS